MSAAPTSGGRADLVSAGQQWLDAYQRRDRDGMAAAGIDNVTISDERTLTERFPAWQTGIRRDLDQVELELTGDTALLTARMTERNGDSNTSAAQHVSRVSQNLGTAERALAGGRRPHHGRGPAESDRPLTRAQNGTARRPAGVETSESRPPRG